VDFRRENGLMKSIELLSPLKNNRVRVWDSASLLVFFSPSLEGLGLTTIVMFCIIPRQVGPRVI